MMPLPRGATARALVLGALAALALGAGAMARVAESWRVVGLNNGAWSLISDAPFGHADGRVQTRELVMFVKPLEAPGGQLITIVDAWHDFDCAGRRVRLLSVTFLGPKGQVEGHSDEPMDWDDVAAGSPGDHVAQVACGKVDRSALESVRGEPAALRDMLLAR